MSASQKGRPTRTTPGGVGRSVFQPKAFMRATAASLSAMGASLEKTVAAATRRRGCPPQRGGSNLLSSNRSSGIQAWRARRAHMWRNDELTPKVRFNKIKWRGTINPMMGPATYQGQGWLTHSTNVFMAAKLTPRRHAGATQVTLRGFPTLGA